MRRFSCSWYRAPNIDLVVMTSLWGVPESLLSSAPARGRVAAGLSPFASDIPLSMSAWPLVGVSPLRVGKGNKGTGGGGGGEREREREREREKRERERESQRERESERVRERESGWAHSSKGTWSGGCEITNASILVKIASN